MLFNKLCQKLKKSYLSIFDKHEDYTLGQLTKVLGVQLPNEFNKKSLYKRILTQSQYVQEGDVVIDAGWYDSKSIVQESLNKGAILVFCDKKIKKDFPQQNVIGIDYPLQRVQKYEKWRKNFYNVKCITITGSVVKTTTTGFINEVFKQTNKQILTGHSMANSHGAILRNIQKINRSHEWWIQEVGGMKPGYIESSAIILKPDIVVITNIGDSHLNTYGNKRNIFLDKSSLDRYAATDAKVIISYDDEILRNAKYKHKILTCSLDNRKADFYAENIKTTIEGVQFIAVCRNSKTSIKVKLKLYGEYNVINALFAIAVGTIANIPLRKIVDAIESYQPSGMRQNFVNIGGYSLMVDVFNAEPKTVLLSALTLTQMKKTEGRRIFITGHIDKLGYNSEKMHYKLGLDLAELAIDIIILFAGDSKFTYKALIEKGNDNVYLMSDRNELDNWIRQNVTRNDLVFFKSGQFEAALVKSIDNVFGTCYQNEQQYNEGYIVKKDGYLIRIRKDNIAEIEGYDGDEVNLKIPNEIDGIPIIRIRPFAFYKNKKIESVIIGDNIVNIGQEAFYQCINLSNIKFSEKMKIIGKNAFNYNKKLKNIIIPKGTIHIDRHAFFDCISMENVYLPQSIGYLGEDVFGVSEMFSSNIKLYFKSNSYIEEYLKKYPMNYEVIS